MKLNKITIQVGGFHDHWLRNGTDNPTLLMAAMEYYHYDFICLMDKAFGEAAIREKQIVEQWLQNKKVYIGHEYAFDWGHVITVENNCSDCDVTNPDWRAELRKLHAGGGFIAFAHIGYPYSTKPAFDPKMIDEVIDEDYTDAVQLERITDYEIVKKRSENGKKLPLVGGWDSHYITSKNDDAKNLYSKDFSPDKHIDTAPGMRSIVFSEDNSLESMKKAIREGKSVLEHVETGELFGSRELIDLLNKEGYKEKMAELDKAYQNLVLENNILDAYKSCRLKFPGKGIVTIAADKELTPIKKETDENGLLIVDKVPMPVMQKDSFLPFYWKGDGAERIWAVKVRNNINIKVIPIILDNQRAVCIETKNDFSGTVRFTKPIVYEKKISAKAGEELIHIFIDNNIPEIFDCQVEVFADEGGYYKYDAKLAVAVAMPSDTSWDKCPSYFADSPEQCGGFGSNRPYPGKEVFSAITKFKWDCDYFYMRCDITDAIQVAPPVDEYMYRSECICLSLDPRLERDKNTKHSVGFMLGFTDIGPVVWSKGIIKDALLTMEKTEKGRIVYTKIPWSLIDEIEFKQGVNIGIHLGFLNDDGYGLLDNLQWPVPAPKEKMETPEIYGVLHLS